MPRGQPRGPADGLSRIDILVDAISDVVMGWMSLGVGKRETFDWPQGQIERPIIVDPVGLFLSFFYHRAVFD